MLFNSLLFSQERAPAVLASPSISPIRNSRLTSWTPSRSSTIPPHPLSLQVASSISPRRDKQNRRPATAPYQASLCPRVPYLPDRRRPGGPPRPPRPRDLSTVRRRGRTARYVSAVTMGVADVTWWVSRDEVRVTWSRCHGVGGVLEGFC